MVLEDFTTYTDFEPDNHIQITSSTKITVVNLDNDQTGYCYVDKGAGSLTSSYMTCKMTANNISQNGRCYFWAYGYGIGDWGNGDGKPYIGARLRRNTSTTNYQITISEKSSVGSNYIDTYEYINDTPGTVFYPEVEWDGGTTLTMYIYSDAERTSLLDTVTLTLHDASYAFRYNYAVMGDNFALGGRETNLIVENMDLGATPSPSDEPSGVSSTIASLSAAGII